MTHKWHRQKCTHCWNKYSIVYTVTKMNQNLWISVEVLGTGLRLGVPESWSRERHWNLEFLSERYGAKTGLKVKLEGCIIPLNIKMASKCRDFSHSLPNVLLPHRFPWCSSIRSIKISSESWAATFWGLTFEGSKWKGMTIVMFVENSRLEMRSCKW